MRTRLRFKVIASLIILSIIALVASQAYWLDNLYHSIWETTRVNIKESMKMADYKELFLRMEQIKEAEGKDKETRSIEYHFMAGSDATDSLSVDATQYDNPLESLAELLAIINSMEDTLLFYIHAAVDKILPINYSAYDSLLANELKERNIHADYTLRVMVMNDSVPFAAMQFTSSDSSTYIPLNEGTYIDHPIQNNAEQLYRLHLYSPERTVLRQMAGILISSVLLLLLIVIAFVYLLRTILKQKTVEELKTDFTNNVTHELKTPIAVAYAANDVLLNHSGSIDDKQQKYLTIIREQLARLTGMVEQILTLSVENRTTFKLNPEPVAVAGLLPSLIEQHKLKTDKRILFNSDVPPGLRIHTDRAHLYNMLSNLIENAVKYTEAKEVQITIKALERKNETLLSVTDNGVGISESNQKRVFDKFYRVPQGNLHNVKGYGLGLYYIKDIMAKQGGTVSLESQPGKGSTFTLHFNK
jgi:signal transduction histidine kinase